VEKNLRTEVYTTYSFSIQHRQIDRARFNVPPNTYHGHITDGFLWVKWPKEQCQSTEGR